MGLAIGCALGLPCAHAGTLRAVLRVTVRVAPVCDRGRWAPFEFGPVVTSRGVARPRSSMTRCADEQPLPRIARDERVEGITLTVIY